jgi:hypothetical protein
MVSSPLCTLLCFWRSPACLNDLVHWKQLKCFSRVNSHMNLKIARRTKWFCTLKAVEGFLPSVQSHVNPKVTRSSAWFSTVTAVKGFSHQCAMSYGSEGCFWVKKICYKQNSCKVSLQYAVSHGSDNPYIDFSPVCLFICFRRPLLCEKYLLQTKQL